MTLQDVRKVQELLRVNIPAFAQKVAPLYAQLQWTWVKHDSTVRYDEQERYVPNQVQIATELLRLTDSLFVQDSDCGIGTGGLWIGGEVNRDGSIDATLRFELDDCFSEEVKF